MTESLINTISGWDGFTKSTAGNMHDQRRGNPSIPSGNSSLDRSKIKMLVVVTVFYYATVMI